MPNQPKQTKQQRRAARPTNAPPPVREVTKPPPRPKKLPVAQARADSRPFAEVGRTVGSALGLGDFGAGIGSVVGKLFGSGAYTLQTNSIMSGALDGASMPPNFSSAGSSEALRVREREYLCDVTSSTAFTLANAFRLNPGSARTFPWLSKVAANFDQWSPNGIVFEFRTTSTDYASTSALGTVILATNYDARDQPFTNKQLMENSAYADSVKPSASMIHGIECSLLERPTRLLYVLSDTVYDPTQTADNRFNDLGNFFYATVGNTSDGSSLGELWITYDVSFYKKIQRPAPPVGMSTGFATLSGGSLGVQFWPKLGLAYTPHWYPNSLGAMCSYDGTGQQLSFSGLVPTARYVLFTQYVPLAGKRMELSIAPAITSPDGTAAYIIQSDATNAYYTSVGADIGCVWFVIAFQALPNSSGLVTINDTGSGAWANADPILPPTTFNAYLAPQDGVWPAFHTD